MNYFLHILSMLEIYALLALSINQQVGLSGLLTLAQAVFYGIGAYTTAIFVTRFGFNFWLTLPIVVAASSISAFIFSYIAGRVQELYFTLATLAIQILFFAITYNVIAVTNGPYGISGIVPSGFGTFPVNTPAGFSILGGISLVLVLTFNYWFSKTPVYRLIKATRDDQVAVLSLGINPSAYKHISLVISAIIAGIAGSLYATYTGYIDPTLFTLDESILILSIVIIGGSGGSTGPIAGAALFVLLPEILKFLQLPVDIASNMRMILFGFLLIVIVRSRPNGILGKFRIQ